MKRNASTAKMTATAAAPMPIPASAPEERPLSLLGGVEVTAGGGAAADVVVVAALLLPGLGSPEVPLWLVVDVAEERRLRILGFAEFQRTCMTSANTV